MSNQMLEAAQAVADFFIKEERRLCLAESCTGGWIAKLLTDLPGSSRWFERGFVTYSNAAKRELLGVPETILDAHGAVSRETVLAMAQGALAHSHADFAIAVSGIAGPDGGSADKPVGLVWLAWAGPCDWLVSESHVFAGEREAVRRQAVLAALAGLLRWGDPTLSLDSSHDTWFQEQVQASIADPGPSVPDEEARAFFAARKAALRD